MCFFFVFLLSGCGKSSFDGIRTGNDSQFVMKYKIFNTTDEQSLFLESGDTIRTEVIVDSGKLSIKIQKDSDTPIYERDDIVTSENFDVEIQESGTYKITVIGENTKGGVNFKKVDGEKAEQEETQQGISEKKIDLGGAFQEINGCAVIYSPVQEEYSFFNEDMCRQEVSPYSTFKIISALLGLQRGVIVDESSTMGYDGTDYGNAEWNGDLTLEEAFENQEVLTAKVAQVLDGGLCVIVDETRVFIPASLVSDSYEKDLSKYKDQDIEFVISEFNPKRRRIIGDRKQLLVAKKLEQQKELFAKIKVGDVMEGTVKNVTDFGAFIDLGGADGLLHISEMSWGRVESPKKVFNVGDHVRVFIKDINDTKIALSMKFPAENPWNGAAEKYAVGNVVKGKVARMTDFGAFVELAPGVDALLHVSQIAKEHIEKPSDVLKVGQEIEAKIVDFNEDEKKISLSIKALLAPETNESEDADVADVDIDAVVAEEN